MNTRMYVGAMMLWLGVATGCSLCPRPESRESCCDLLCHQKSDVPLGVVHVGGLVDEPRAIQVPDHGMTLGQALVQVRISSQSYRAIDRRQREVIEQRPFKPRKQASHVKRSTNVALVSFDDTDEESDDDSDDLDLGELEGGSAPVIADDVPAPAKVKNPAQAAPTDGKTIGDGNKSDGNDEEEELDFQLAKFVVLERNHLGLRQYFHFPLKSVVHDVIGQVALQAGDIVRVVSAAETGLDDKSDPDARVAVSGLVGVPRVVTQSTAKSSTPTLDSQAGFNGRLGELISTTSLVQPSDGATHVMLSRRSDSGLALNHYLIQKDGPIEPMVELHDADQVVFTQLGLVPLVRAGIMETARRERLKELSKRSETIADRIKQHNESSRTVDSVRQFGTGLAKQMTNWW